MATIQKRQARVVTSKNSLPRGRTKQGKPGKNGVPVIPFDPNRFSIRERLRDAAGEKNDED